MSRNISFKDLQIGTMVLIKHESKWRTITNRQYAANKSTLILWFDNDNWEYARNVVEVMSSKDKNLDVFTKNHEDNKSFISIDKEYTTLDGKAVKLFGFFENRWRGIVQDKSHGKWSDANWDAGGKLCKLCNWAASSVYDLVEKTKFKIEKIKPIRITKGIPYFDFNLVVPDDTKYVATNKSGWIYAYPIEIAVNDETCFDVIDESKRIYEIGTCVGYIKNYSGDWKNSLVEIGI
jgi:hypothetical protein